MAEIFLLGIFLATIIGILGVKLNFLSRGGALAAIVIGGLIFGFGGFIWALVLLVFFFSSSLFSIVFKKRKIAAELKYAKGSQRDQYQVLANGGLAALMSVFHAIYPDENWPWIAFLAVLATVTADTWATEIGGLSKSLPISIRTLKKVEKGTSGGISVLGLSASFIGSLLIASFDLMNGGWSNQTLLIAVVGWVGAIIDSLLGATIQVIYWNDKEKIEVESPPEINSIPIRGLSWMNNDLVNLISGLLAGFLAIILLLA